MAEKLNRLSSYNFTRHAGNVKVINLKKSGESVFDKRILKIERNFSAPFVGRDYELSELKSIFFKHKKKLLANQNLKRADKISSNGELQEKQIVIGIRGEAGIGKTRLIREFLKSNSKHFLSAQSDSFVQSPYLLFLNMLKTYCSISRLDSPVQIKEKLKFAHNDLANYIKANSLKKEFPKGFNIICHLLGIKSKDSRIKLPASELKLHIQISLSNFILGVGAKANFHNEPLAFVLDNVHWIDDASMNSLLFLLMTMKLKREHISNPIQILPILLYRPEFKFSKDFEKNFNLTEIEIQPLDNESAKKLINESGMKSGVKNLKTAKDSNRVDEIISRSEGNPLYIQEWNKFMNDKKKIAGAEVPDSINLLIKMRLQNLKPEEKDVLECASVLGKEFTIELLEDILKKLGKDFDFTGILLRLIENKFIEKSKDVSNRFSFHHDVIRDVIYDSILKENKKVIHYSAGSSMEKLYKENLTQHFFKLAEHYTKSDSEEKAVEYLIKSGDKAKDSFENEKAIEYYDKIMNSGWMSDEALLEIYFKKLELLKHTGSWDEAIKICDQMKKEDFCSSDRNCMLKIHFHLAEILHNQGNFAESIVCTNKIIKKKKPDDDEIVYSEAHGIMGRNYIQTGKLENAHKHLTLFHENSQKLNDLKCIAQSLEYLGIYNRITGNFPEALSNYKKSMSIYERLGDTNKINHLFLKLGNLFYYFTEYSKAIEYFEKAMEANLKTGSLYEYSIALGNLGNAYQSIGDTRSSKNLISKKLEISKKLNSKESIATSYSAMGSLSIDKGNYTEAFQYYEKSLKLYEEINKTGSVANAKFNIGLVNYYLGNYGEALKCYNEQLEIYIKLSNTEGIHRGYLNLGNLHKKLRNYGVAEDCYKKALSLARETKAKRMLILTLLNYSEFLFDLKNYDDSLRLVNEAAEICGNYEHKTDMLQIKLLTEKIFFYSEIEKINFDIKNSFHNFVMLNECIGRTEELLNESSDESETANIHYELWKMKKHIPETNPKSINANKITALKIFTELYKKTQNIEYQSFIFELKSN